MNANLISLAGTQNGGEDYDTPDKGANEKNENRNSIERDINNCDHEVDDNSEDCCFDNDDVDENNRICIDENIDNGKHIIKYSEEFFRGNKKEVSSESLENGNESDINCQNDGQEENPKNDITSRFLFKVLLLLQH